jgi:hypothetical protein
VLDFCHFHAQDLPVKEKKMWNAKFVEVDQSVLCDLASVCFTKLLQLTTRLLIIWT